MRSAVAAGCLLALATGCSNGDPPDASGPASGDAAPGSSAGEPLLGASHVLVPDPGGDGVLLVSGPPEGTPGEEMVLARWDGSSWRDVRTPPGDAPAARNFFAAAFDPVHDVVVLHGGETADGISAETWLWDGESWRRGPAEGPGARTAAALAWDPASGTTVLQGGNGRGGAIRDDTWAFDGEAWTRLAVKGPRPLRWPAAMVATGDGTLLAYGGHQVHDEELPPALGDTWRWQDGSWRPVPDADGPGRLVNAQGLLHPELGTLLLGGSTMAAETGDVWRWAEGRWQVLARDVLPPRQAFGAAYDDERGVVVLTGGVVEPGQTVRHQDVWEWDGDPSEPAELVADRPPA